MATKCNDKETIKRDGSSQAGRFLKMLDPANAPLDDRRPEDILVFAKHYADLVRFYDINEEVDWASTTNENNNAAAANEEAAKKTVYTWKEFFYKDIAVLVASIAQYKNKLPLIKQEYDDKRKEVDSNPAIENYKDLFTIIIKLLHRISRWHSRSIDDHPLKNELELKINATLTPALKKLIAYDKGSEAVKDEGLEIRKQYDVFKTGFLHVDYKEIQEDESIYEGKGIAQEEGKDIAKKIKHAALYVDDIFHEVLKVYKELTDRSEFYFKAAIENYPEHQPHMALFLAFVELFTYAQKEMNGLTQKHLEFYYRDVLHLHERAASPDAVYLIYELAKEATEYDLQKGTALTAGKDATGKELIYKTADELVINKAKVKELKTVFLDKRLKESHAPIITEADYEIKKIYAAPVANSVDGNGTPFTVAESAWPAFGYFDTAVKDNNVVGKEAEIGFAIASPQLFLAEGTRRILISISENDFSELQKSPIVIYLTGSKEWIKIETYQEDAIKDGIITNNDVQRYYVVKNSIMVVLPISEQAVVAYDEKIHGGNLSTPYPVIKVVFGNTNAYNQLKEVKLSTISIYVEVSSVKTLILENDNTSLDSAKAILPFTASPKKGYSFYVGSKEVLFKQLLMLSINFDKAEEVLIGKERVAKMNIALLNGRKWKYISNKGKPLEYNFGTKEISNAKILILNPEIPLQNNRETNYQGFPVKENSLAGFMKLDLVDAVDSSTFIDANNKVVLPGTFIIKNPELNYISLQVFEPGVEQFFHIYPFGTIETFPVNNKIIRFEYLDKSKDNLLINTNDLLPQIKYGSNKDNFTGENQYLSASCQQGNLFIGIEDLKPPQNLSLLFKIADGTAEDNDSEPPKINWSYLINNEWRPLPDENIITDSTYGLQATGIMLFDFPADATNNNTVVAKGLHWLCASVDKDADKIPKIINVIAQANKAVFYDQQNDPLHYKIPLPAESIAKLSVKVPEVKVVQQPFESFDGKMREEGKVFYARASERLRHKHRAITAWDYEHLVLQHFPGIYKVKCLTHTDPECICRHKPETPALPEGESKCCCGQVAPGHVLIVPVSNLRNKNAVDILKPRTGRLTLIQIEKYLKKLTSPFVHVKAKNPKFEEIKTAFNVKFYTGTDKGRYLKRLNEDIVKFLTPWAFDASREVIFGGSVYASAVINFIEELDYVDYITCFRMIHIVKGCCESDTFTDLLCPVLMKKIDDTIPADVELKKRFLNVIEATSPQAILTSAKKHCIELIIDPPKTKDCNCS